MTATIQQIRGLAEPHKGYQFQVTLPDPRGGDGAGAELLQFRCTATALPGQEIDQVLTNLGSYNVRDPGRGQMSGNWATSFVEGTDLQIIRRVFAWQKLCFNQETGVQGTRLQTHATAVVELLNNARIPVLARRVIGIWPFSVPDVPLDDANSEASRIEVTWSFDYWVDISI